MESRARTKLQIDPYEALVDCNAQLYYWVNSGIAQRRFFELNPEEIDRIGFFDDTVISNHHYMIVFSTNVIVYFKDESKLPKNYHAKVSLQYNRADIRSNLNFDVLEFTQI